jgi:hypothetical protein
MENGPHAFVLGVATVDLKLMLGTNVHGRDVPHVPIHIKTSSKALSCREGLKLVLESNEFVITFCAMNPKILLVRPLVGFLVGSAADL